MGGRGDEELRRRMERAAELRAGRLAHSPEEAEEIEREDELNRRRREVDAARRADYLIRDAMARGEFDHLQYAGKPIPNLDNVNDPDWWLKGLIQREQLTGLGPEALVLRVEDARLESTLDALYTEQQVRDSLAAFNRRIIEARRQLLGGPPVITKTRDVEREVALWHERRAAAAAARAAEEAEDADDRPPPFWRRWFGRGTGG
ncbi:DnaJ family domain-containing protein [Sinomonas atrocyanea]